MGPYQGKGTGEYGLFRELLGCFSAGNVMLADSYYCSFFSIAALQARGVDILFEQHGARHTDFRTGAKLGVRDHVVQWSKPVARPAWMTPEEYAAYPTTLTLREMKVRNKILVTSFLNPHEVAYCPERSAARAGSRTLRHNPAMFPHVDRRSIHTCSFPCGGTGA